MYSPGYIQSALQGIYACACSLLQASVPKKTSDHLQGNDYAIGVLMVFVLGLIQKLLITHNVEKIENHSQLLVRE